MTNEQSQLLAAAVLDTASRFGGAYAGEIDRLIDEVNGYWPGKYSKEDTRQAIQSLYKLGIIDRSSVATMSTFVSINHAIASRRLQTGAGMTHHPKSIAPLLNEYARFGREWLRGMWARNMVSQRDSAEAPHGPPELAVSFVLTEDKRKTLVQLLDIASSDLDALEVANSEKAQARAYIIATRALAEAPEPPVSLIWELINRASLIAGIASLFVSIIALFA